MSETLKLQRNASIYTKRRQRRKAATRTAQLRVNLLQRTERSGKHNLGDREREGVKPRRGAGEEKGGEGRPGREKGERKRRDQENRRDKE